MYFRPVIKTQQDITTLHRALDQAAASTTLAHPELTDADREYVYRTYRDYFREEPENDPPFSILPAEDALFVALWDVIVDRETEGIDVPDPTLEAVYVRAFEQLLAGRPVGGRETTDTEPVTSTTAPKLVVAPAPPPPPQLVARAAPAPDGEEEPVAAVGPGRTVAAPGGSELSNVPEAAPRELIYELKITLEGSQPPIWRRVEVPAAMPLTEFHHVIQSAMGWTDSHLYEFHLSGTGERFNYGDLNEALREEGDHLGYEYDFGDSWHHDIELERVREADPVGSYPVCTGGNRACPPEDIGGMPGYLELLAKLNDPGHPEHEEVASWVTQGFNPGSFNRDQANVRLSRHGRAGFVSAV